MKRLTCVLLSVVVLITTISFVSFVNADEELYSDKYDYVNAEEILSNDRLRDQYYKCFIGDGPCVTADAAFYKGNFPETIVTKCRKCTEKQKDNFNKIVVWYTENRPDEWKVLVKKMVEEAKQNASA